MKNKTLMSDICMVIVTIVWGYGFIATKMAAEYMSSYQLIFYRFLLSSVLMCTLFYKDLKTVTKNDVKKCTILGAFLCAGFLTQTEAIYHTTVAKNAFLTTLNVIFVPITVALAHKKKIDKYSISGCAFAVTGTAVLSLNMDLSVNYGDFLSILCAVFFSFHIYYIGEFAQNTKITVLATGQIIVSAAIAFVPTVLTGGLILPYVGPGGIYGIFYLAVFSTCFCFIMQTYCQRITSQIKAVIIFALEAVFASIFAVFLLGDETTPRFFIGSALIFTAVIISSTKLEFLKRDKRGKEASYENTY